MAQFTRRQLRNYVNDTSNFSGDRDFSLVNNLSTTAYFNIEGVNGKDIFNTASLSSLANCSVITESMHAAFIINPNSTATFSFEPSVPINKEDIRFIASNTLVFNNDDPTASGSAFGVTLDTNA